MTRYAIFTRPTPILQGQLFIAGKGEFKDATVKVQLADCTMQDAPAKILSEVAFAAEGRPATDWITFELPVPFSKPGEFFNIANMMLLAEITSNGKLLYVTKVTHRVDISNDAQRYFATVVVEKVESH